MEMRQEERRQEYQQRTEELRTLERKTKKFLMDGAQYYHQLAIKLWNEAEKITSKGFEGSSWKEGEMQSRSSELCLKEKACEETMEGERGEWTEDPSMVVSMECV